MRLWRSKKVANLHALLRKKPVAVPFKRWKTGTDIERLYISERIVDKPGGLAQPILEE